jgi:hypothetical protein
MGGLLRDSVLDLLTESMIDVQAVVLAVILVLVSVYGAPVESSVFPTFRLSENP